MTERNQDDVERLKDADALEAARDEAWQAHQRGESGAGLRYARCVDRLCNLRHERQRYGTLRWEDGSELRLHEVDPAVADEERVTLGVPPLVETRAEIAAENRRRAESRAAEQGLPDGVEVARVWRPCSAQAVRERWDREGVPVWVDPPAPRRRARSPRASLRPRPSSVGGGVPRRSRLGLRLGIGGPDPSRRSSGPPMWRACRWATLARSSSAAATPPNRHPS
ncbi:MAG: hypothetical protein ACRD0K_11595 [Egibacteraceae bacterium]